MANQSDGPVISALLYVAFLSMGTKTALVHSEGHFSSFHIFVQSL